MVTAHILADLKPVGVISDPAGCECIISWDAPVTNSKVQNL